MDNVTIPAMMLHAEVMEIATIRREFVEQIAPDLEELRIVLTGERLEHIRSSRGEKDLAYSRISRIPGVLTNPDKVLRNRKDPEIVNFYQWDSAIGKYLRVTLWLNVSGIEGKLNSVLGFRVAREKWVERDINDGLLIYEKGR